MPFDPNESRDDHGRWSEGGGAGTTATFATEAEASSNILAMAKSEHDENYSNIALRIEDVSPDPSQVGAVLNSSRVWDNGVPTDQLVEGTSAIKISGESGPTEAGLSKALQYSKSYIGETAYLLAYDTGNAGEDLGEVVTRSPKVIAIYARDLETGIITKRVG